MEKEKIEKIIELINKIEITAENKEEAKQKILNQDWDDIIDEYDSETLTEGYEIVDIW